MGPYSKIMVIIVAIVAMMAAVFLAGVDSQADGSEIKQDSVEIGGLQYMLDNYTAESHVTGYVGDTDIVHIPSSIEYGDMTYDVVTVGNSSFNNSSISEVYIPSSVIIIGNSAFYGSTVSYVFIEGNPIIGSMAFFQCNELKFMDIQGNPSYDNDHIFSMGNSCIVRSPEVGSIDSYLYGNTEITYIGLDEFLVRYSTQNAPGSVPEIGFDIVSAGSNLSVPVEAEVIGYDVTMYVGEVEVTEGYKVESDIVVTLSYAIQEFTVSFVSDGETVKSEVLAYGSVIIAPTENPVKEPDEQHTYEFTGWNGFTEGMAVTGDAEFEAQFLEGPRMYTITFISDGETIETMSLEYGAVITAPRENPVKEPDEQHTYEFTGWNGFTEGMAVTGDAEFEAQFLEGPRMYTVSFVSDGETVKSETLAYGSVITAPAEIPTKEHDAQYTYSFTGWKDFKDGITVSGDVTFEAEYSKTLRMYTVTFVSDGVTVLEQVIGYGSVIQVPDDPVKGPVDGKSYEFSGWDGYTEGMTVTGDVTFNAVFNEVVPDDGSGSTVYIVVAVIVVIAILLAVYLFRYVF